MAPPSRQPLRVLLVDYPQEPFAARMGNRLQVVWTAVKHTEPDALAAALPQADALVLRSHPRVDAALLQQAPQLRLILRGGAGLDHIDRQAAAQQGVVVRATPGANAPSVGEHAVGALLSLLHQLHRADTELRQGQWTRNARTAHELRGHTVGLLGFGATGQAVAQRLQGFGARVLAYDKYRPLSAGHPWAEPADLPTLWREATVLSPHLPLTAETHSLLNRRFLDRFQHPLLVLNLARGPLLDLEAVLQALAAGQVRGAALDVFPNEHWDRLTSRQAAQLQALRGLDQVLLTPHIAGQSHESYGRIQDRLVDELVAFFRPVFNSD